MPQETLNGQQLEKILAEIFVGCKWICWYVNTGSCWLDEMVFAHVKKLFHDFDRMTFIKSKWWNSFSQRKTMCKYQYLYNKQNLLPRKQRSETIGSKNNSCFLFQLHVCKWFRHKKHCLLKKCLQNDVSHKNIS